MTFNHKLFNALHPATPQPLDPTKRLEEKLEPPPPSTLLPLQPAQFSMGAWQVSVTAKLPNGDTPLLAQVLSCNSAAEAEARAAKVHAALGQPTLAKEPAYYELQMSDLKAKGDTERVWRKYGFDHYQSKTAAELNLELAREEWAKHGWPPEYFRLVPLYFGES
jgi:hypothetical protein